MLDYNFIVAIDPDTEKSGVAFLSKRQAYVDVKKMPLGKLMNELQKYAASFPAVNLCVIVEGGFLNQSNFHLQAYQNNKYASKIGHDIGRNHQVALDIIEIAKTIGLNVHIVRPLRKIWKGTDRKITAKELTDILSKNKYYLTKKRTNQDERDAVLLALVYAENNLKF